MTIRRWWWSTYTHLRPRSLQFEQWVCWPVVVRGRSLRSQRTLGEGDGHEDGGGRDEGAHLRMRHAPQAENCCLDDFG